MAVINIVLYGLYGSDFLFHTGMSVFTEMSLAHDKLAGGNI